MAQENETFLGRWSRLKREEEKKLPEKTAEEEKADAGHEDAPPALPPVEDLTPQSDFKAFMHPKVQDSLRRVALKKLFADPHFNVEDLNEAYSGDWTGGEPITQEMLKRLNQARTHLFSADEKKALEDEEERLARPAEAQEPPPEQQETMQEANAQEAKPDEPGRQDT